MKTTEISHATCFETCFRFVMDLLFFCDADMQSRGCSDAIVSAALNADDVVTRLLIGVMGNGVAVGGLLVDVAV